MSNASRKQRKTALRNVNARIAEIEATLPGEHWGPSPDGTPAIDFRLAITSEETRAEYVALITQRDELTFEREPKRAPRRHHETKAERQARQAAAAKADAAAMAKLPIAVIDAAIARSVIKLERTIGAGQ